MNIDDRYIKFLKEGALSDYETAALLIASGRTLHGLFFCHLSIEKALKSHVAKQTREIPPKTHNLRYLLDRSELMLVENAEDFLGVLMKYQLEGRYPDYNVKIPSKDTAKQYLEKTKELLEWLISRL